MIEEDIGKPITLFEYISDEPRDAKPYIEYLKDFYASHLEYWKNLPEELVPKSCVLIKIDFFLVQLDNILMKLARERKE